MDDIQLRAIALPVAATLVNTEVQRALGNCNTKTIAEVTSELVEILKNGKLPVAEPKQEVLPPLPQAVNQA